jgi:RND family efflux transporter MFP subunit
VAAVSRKGLSKLVGPTHTWVKATVLAALAAVLLLTLGRGDYTADGTFLIEPIQQQMIQARFDGHLSAVEVEPGDVVRKGDVLARLDTDDLQARMAEKRAEYQSYLTQVEQADAEGRSKTYERQVADSEARRVAAQIDVLNYQIDKATLTAPMDGTVISGDLKRQIGSSVQTGQQLFEIAPLHELRATLSIPEDQIADVREGRTGELATALYPGRRIGFSVERVIPVAEVSQGNNVFKVRVALKDLDLSGRHNWLRPGMEGVGKVTLGRRPFAFLWSRRLVNWVRMKLWW